MRKCSKLLFNPQHRTPILPQVPIVYPKEANLVVRVGYLLGRGPVVKPEPHPLETEMGFTLQREHSRYARHDSDTLNQFMSSRDQTVDAWGRSDPNQITSNYFGLEMYQDSLKTVLNRYKPLPRTLDGDFVDLLAEQTTAAPPKRHTIQRALTDYLFLLTKGADGKWGVPTVEREEHETLRMSLDRAVNDHHKGAIDTFTFSNAPQAVIKHTEGDREVRTFIYNVVYLAGRPDFATLGCADHAWVTRGEMRQYDGHYSHPEALSVLRDIAPDAVFESL